MPLTLGRLAFAVSLAASSSGRAAAAQAPCTWCGAADAPASLASKATLAPAAEQGERLILTGRVLEADGKTPAGGVLVYLYQTHADGLYARDEREHKHGLRGWLRTGADGRYEITTIRPGRYPDGTAPAHIHVTVTAPGQSELYLDDFVFADDPLVTPAYRKTLQGRGGPGAVVTLTRGKDGTWRGTRDLRLERAPPPRR